MSEPRIAVRDLYKVFPTRRGPFVAIDHVSHRHSRRRILHDRRTERLRQDDVAAHPGRPRDARRAATVAIARRDMARPGNSMVFQGDSLFPWMTVCDNAAYGLRMRRRPEAEIARSSATTSTARG